MKLRRNCVLAIAASMFVCASIPARAQVSLGGHASYTKSDGADGTWAGGVQLRLRLPGPLGVEGLVDYRRTTYGALGADVLRVEQYPVQASVLLFLLPGPVQPYVLGGAGWYYTRSTFLGTQAALGSTTQHTYGGHAGAGLELGAGRNASFYADVRYVFLHVDSVSTIRDRLETNSKPDFWHATAGVNFKF